MLRTGIMNTKPHSIIFFHNGMAAVCDRDGEQIPKYNGQHADSIDALRRDGFEWRQLDVLGAPVREVLLWEGAPDAVKRL